METLPNSLALTEGGGSGGGSGGSSSSSSSSRSQDQGTLYDMRLVLLRQACLRLEASPGTAENLFVDHGRLMDRRIRRRLKPFAPKGAAGGFEL